MKLVLNYQGIIFPRVLFREFYTYQNILVTLLMLLICTDAVLLISSRFALVTLAMSSIFAVSVAMSLLFASVKELIPFWELMVNESIEFFYSVVALFISAMLSTLFWSNSAILLTTYFRCSFSIMYISAIALPKHITSAVLALFVKILMYLTSYSVVQYLLKSMISSMLPE